MQLHFGDGKCMMLFYFKEIYIIMKYDLHSRSFPYVYMVSNFSIAQYYEELGICNMCNIQYYETMALFVLLENGWGMST